MDNTIDTLQAARILGCTPQTLRAWVSRRRVPHIKVGRLTRFRLRDLEQWLDQCSVPVEQRLSVVEESLRLHRHALHRQDAELLQMLSNLRDRIDRLEQQRRSTEAE